MEKKSVRYKLFPVLCIVIFFLSLNTSAQESLSEDSKKLLLRGIDTFNNAYNNWDKNEFRKSLNLFREASMDRSGGGLAEYWAGTVFFFLSQHDLFSKEKSLDKKQGIKNAKNGIDILTKSIERAPDFSESYALRGVLRGILIKMKPTSVFTQGIKVGKDRDKALELDMTNPRVHYLTGVSFWYAPEILGGRDKALEHLLEAEKLFEKEDISSKDNILPRWGRSTCLAFIGDVFLSENRNEKAYEYYKKALDVNLKDPVALRGLKSLDK